MLEGRRGELCREATMPGMKDALREVKGEEGNYTGIWFEAHGCPPEVANAKEAE